MCLFLLGGLPPLPHSLLCFVRLCRGYIGGLLYNGSTLASQHNVIVVTVQYRLGGLGFLYTGDSIMGNYGLEDQRFGMQWVQGERP